MLRANDTPSFSQAVFDTNKNKRLIFEYKVIRVGWDKWTWYPKGQTVYSDRGFLAHEETNKVDKASGPDCTVMVPEEDYPPVNTSDDTTRRYLRNYKVVCVGWDNWNWYPTGQSINTTEGFFSHETTARATKKMDKASGPGDVITGAGKTGCTVMVPEEDYPPVDASDDTTSRQIGEKRISTIARAIVTVDRREEFGLFDPIDDDGEEYDPDYITWK